MTSMSGPDAAAVWKVESTSGGTEFIAIPDASDPQRSYYLPRHHQLVTGADGTPQLSLTMVLQAAPPADDDDLEPLVRQASLSMGVRPADIPDLPEGFAALFARTANVMLTRRDAPPLASVSASGAQLRATLAASLERSDALAVLAAIHNQGDELFIRAEITYRAVAAAARAHLTGRWSDVYDVACSLTPVPTVDNLRRLFRESLAQVAIHVSPSEGEELLYQSFVASAKAVLFNLDGQMAGRPSEYFTIDLTSSAADCSLEKEVTIETPLRDVLGGCLDHGDPERVLSFLTVTPGGSGPSTGPASTTATRSIGVPRRVRTTPSTRDTEPRQSRLAIGPAGRLKSTSAVLAVARPDTIALNDQIARAGKPAYLVGVHAVAFDDFEEPDTVRTDLPFVDDPAGWVFGDTGLESWYAPTFEVLEPARTDDASSSPFVFWFQRVGATASGQAGINARVTFTLRAVMGPEAAAALGGGVGRPLPVGNAQVVLDLPFRDANGTNQRQRLTAQTSWQGNVVTAVVPLLDDWARLAYGALSQAGFQQEPARISISWSFPAWRTVAVDPLIVWGGKTAILPVRYQPQAVVVRPPDHVENLHIASPLNDPDPTAVTSATVNTATLDTTYLDATAAALRTPSGAYQFAKIPAGATRTRSELGSRVTIQPALIQRLPISGEFDGRLGGVIATNGGRPSPQPRSRRMSFTVARSQVLDILFPCDEVGSCYVEQRSEGQVPIGCEDALKLGQAPWRQYQEIAALARPAYKVYRSLQQPGRFLVLPARYSVTRYAADDLKAYQPALLLYALLDAADPSANQVVVQATLQADIDAYAWQDLLDQLEDYAADPTLSLITDVEGTPSFTWTLVNLPAVSINAGVVPNGISVAMQSDLAHALLLRDMLLHDGIIGTLTFRLPDGTDLRSALQMGLVHVTGPAARGPVEVSVTAASATLVNRIERPVDVSALRIYRGPGTPTEIPVEQTLAAAAATTVSLVPADGAPPPTADQCQPVYTVANAQPADLVEVRNFVEDISMNIVFMDLIDHVAHGIARLDVRAQLVDASGVQEVAMTGSPASGTTSFVLPLTKYLASRIVRYQVSTAGTDATTVGGPWQTWDVATKGALISLDFSSTGLTP